MATAVAMLSLSVALCGFFIQLTLDGTAHGRRASQRALIERSINVAPHQSVFDDLATPCFSGRSQTIEGRSALLFGVDAMAALGMKDLIPGMQLDLGLVPPRSGYRLGMLVARELSKKYSIQTMAHWSQAEAKPRVRAALERISANRNP